MSNSLWPHGLKSTWNSPGQNTGVGNLSLLQGIFPTQGSNPGLPHCRQILYQLSHKGGLRTLEWVNYPFSRGSSQPRNQTRVSCIAGGFFTNWAIRKAINFSHIILKRERQWLIHPTLRYQGNVLHELTHIRGLPDKDYCPHFINKEIEAEVAWVNCLLNG